MGRPEISHWESCIVWNSVWLSTSAIVTDREMSIGSVTSGWMQWSIQRNSCESICCCSSVAKSCLTLYDPMDPSTLDFPVLHYLLEFAQTHVHWVGDAIQPSHPLFPPSSPAPSLSQHQGLFQWVSSYHQVAKVLEHQLQHQFFQWIIRVDFPMLPQQEVWEECSTS